MIDHVLVLQVVISAKRYVGTHVWRRTRKVLIFNNFQYILKSTFYFRLVELSVCKKARLDSDSTLVAVITAVGF